ncbi:uncharacterized protein LOC111118344 isoform X2 [Crassostrea virginica]
MHVYFLELIQKTQETLPLMQKMHAQISNLKLQLDSNNISYNKCTCQMENATEGAVKEVTWWSWIWQSLVNVFWVVMALNNLFVGFIFFFRGPSGL